MGNRYHSTFLANFQTGQTMEELAVIGLFKKCKLSVFGPAAVMLLMLSGCAIPGFFTVGGTIPGAYEVNRGSGKANFGGFFDACSLGHNQQWGEFVYHDPTTVEAENYDWMDKKLRIKAMVTKASGCDSDSENWDPSQIGLACTLCYTFGDQGTKTIPNFPGDEEYQDNTDFGAAVFTYVSQDSKNPGWGTGFVCIGDNGEGNEAEDYFRIKLFDHHGPWPGYQNVGTDVSGNIQDATEAECTIY